MVKADNDDEYFQLNDFNTMIAYQYWESYGLSADNQTSYTETLNTISQGTTTGTFTFTGQFSGSCNATVDLGISGLTTTDLDNVDDILSSRTFYYFGEGSETQPLIEMSISSGDNQGTEYIPRYGCNYNPSATGASATMTCTPNTYDGAFTIPDQEVKVTSIDVAMNSVTDYSLTLTLRNENTVRGSLSGTLALSGGGQGTLTMTESGSATTTSVNVNTLQYVFPLMTGTIDNNYPQSHNKLPVASAYKRKTFYNNSNDPFMVIFLGKNMYYGNGQFANTVQLFGAAETNFNQQYVPDNLYGETFRPWNISGSLLYCYNLSVASAPQYPNFNALLYAKWNFSNFNGVIPLYVGYKSGMSDSLYRYVYHSDRNIEAINAQTAADQQHHDEMMDTSDSSHIASDGNALIDSAGDKFGDLFFPLQHAIETANDLSNVQATGVIRLPAIFSDDKYWYLDLTQIEQKLPEAWNFIRSLCQLAVSMYLILGLYHLFFGKGDDTNDS